MYSVHRESENLLVSTTDIYLLISHCHKFQYFISGQCKTQTVDCSVQTRGTNDGG